MITCQTKIHGVISHQHAWHIGTISRNQLKRGHDLFNHAFELITIADKTGVNKITLRISCQDSGILKKFAETKWQLVTMLNQNKGLHSITIDEYPIVTKFHQVNARMRIEIVKKKKEIRPEVIGYYIAKKYSVDELKNQNYNTFIESEFISENEVFGGYLQICQTHCTNSHSISMKAETLDDPMVDPKTGNFELTKQNHYLSIGFLDHSGMKHAWRVLVKHDISTFPIVYWIGEPDLP